ncbi:hypothetical protein QWZ13_05825 [Reinekea marina]|nr:hypothetical protein [Reinekea marina]MDN3648424.1 hypothetical protein [Reinekea marina]
MSTQQPNRSTHLCSRVYLRSVLMALLYGGITQPLLPIYILQFPYITH